MFLDVGQEKLNFTAIVSSIERVMSFWNLKRPPTKLVLFSSSSPSPANCNQLCRTACSQGMPDTTNLGVCIVKGVGLILRTFTAVCMMRFPYLKYCEVFLRLASCFETK